MDYGLIITWSVSLENDEFSCDAIVVFKETNSSETLVDNSPVSSLTHSYHKWTSIKNISLFRFIAKVIKWTMKI